MNRAVKLLLAGIACAGSLIAGIVSASGAEASLRLENARIAVEIDRTTGAVRSIRDKQQDVVYPQTGVGFEVVTTEGTLRSEKATAVDTKAGEAELSFTGNGLDVTLHYRLGAEDHFLEKWLEIKASGGKPYFLKSVILEDMATTAFSEIHFHDDNTIWHCPINLFLRGEKGGCFAGLEYPYWELEQKGAEGFRLGYTPNYQAAEGEVNLSEKYFIGVYRKEGIHRVSQGPYPGRGRCKLLSWGGKCGVSQHFKGGIPNPVTDVPLESLDWGEVWAMQEFMQHVLPDDLPLPEDGFWVWQNGWWAGLWKIEDGILDRLKQAGIHDVMTAHTWYGRGNHPLSPPYIDQMRIQPMGFPKDGGIAGLPGPAGPAAGLHANHAEVKLDSFVAGEFTPEFIMPPAMKALYDHGQKIGVHVSSFSLPGLSFKDKPEWASVDEDGKVSEYLFGHKVSCPACDPYMDHMLELLDHVFTRYKPRWWGFDGRWLSYWEVPMYRPGAKGLGFDTCHAKDHGHLPGDNLYKEWKNIQKLLREIRRRHPTMCLEQYLGLKRGGPWALRYLNCDDNYYETNGAVMNRFQAWHNQNDRFRPVYKNYAAIFGGSPAAFRTSVISSISCSSYCQIGPGYADLALEENREFLKKWRGWATQNYDYLKVKRDLFDSPGELPVDGSAHIIKDRGFLFLFPVGGTSARASIPINRWLQLEESPNALYQIKEVYPREGTDLGIYKYGDEFLYDMPTDAAVILAIEPAARGSGPRPSDLSNQGNPVVIPAFSSVASADAEETPVSKESKSPDDSAIVNGTDWMDAAGNRIVAHEGDLARFNGVFYWYGSSYAGNPSGKFDISDGPVWNGVQVYRSSDLKNWEYRGVCLPRPENGWGKLGATGRGHVIYNEKTKKYVMWYRWYLHVPGAFLVVAVADHPEGPFTALGPREMGTANGFASDMNVFQDDDGKAYVIYCDHGGHGVKGDQPLYAIRIDRLSGDYLTSNKDGVVVFARGCEAPAMVKYKGTYVAVASGVHGWEGSDTKCATADSPLGPWKEQGHISEQKTWHSQVSDLIYLEESDTVLALCDQWWIPDKDDINKSRYFFLPLYLDEKTGRVKMEYRERWKPLD